MITETATLTTNIEISALPHTVKNDVPTVILNYIKNEIYHRKKHKEIYTFNLTFESIDYAVNLYAPNHAQWLLVFNKKGNNDAPLAFKLLKGYRLVTYYSIPEFQHILEFFNKTNFSSFGGLKSFFKTLDDNLQFVEQVPFTDRITLMDEHDPSTDSDERDKIYFGGFVHLGTSKNGVQRKRTNFNTWKVQHILPVETWEQIRLDNTISVIFVTKANAKYSLECDEIAYIKKQIEAQLNRSI